MARFFSSVCYLSVARWTVWGFCLPMARLPFSVFWRLMAGCILARFFTVHGALSGPGFLLGLGARFLVGFLGHRGVLLEQTLDEKTRHLWNGMAGLPANYSVPAHAKLCGEGRLT